MISCSNSFFFLELVNVSRFGLDFNADLFYSLLEDLKYFTLAKPSILENTPSILPKQIIIIYDYCKSILTVCGKFN